MLHEVKLYLCLYFPKRTRKTMVWCVTLITHNICYVRVGVRLQQKSHQSSLGQQRPKKVSGRSQEKAHYGSHRQRNTLTVFQTMLSSHAYLLVTGVIHSKIFGIAVAVRRFSQLVSYIDRALCLIATPEDSVNRRAKDLLPENKQHVFSFFPIWRQCMTQCVS